MFRSTRKQVDYTEDLRRVKRLPTREAFDVEALVREQTAKWKTPTGVQTLRPIQALGLKEVGECKGLFGPQRVGAGKTLFSLLAPAVLGAKRPMLLLPASLVEKTKREMRGLMKDWQIPRNIRILSYEMLGRVNASEELELWRPDVLICDEVHRLKNKRAGVTRRVSRYMKGHPETLVVAISGTVMRNSIKDFAHILRWCLKDNAPVPLENGELEQWADALDEKVNPLRRMNPGPLLTLVPSFEDGEDDLQSARRAFHARLTNTPGVVATGKEEGVTCSLYVRALEYEVGAATEQHFKPLRADWVTPDGWAFSQAVQLWQYARELAIGFHYYYDPHPPDEWLEARRNWAKFVRETLRYSRSLDTELQVANAVDAGQLRTDTLAAWRQIKPTFEPRTKVAWHDTAALQVCEKWMEKGAGIVWSDHIAFGKELSKRTGVPYYANKGLDAKGEFISGHDPKKPMIASVTANGTGHNLQAWNRNLLTSVPPGGGMALEQLIGRTHREGQQADQVEIDILLGCFEHMNDWQKALREARMVADAQGHDQKILIADVDFPESISNRQGDRWKKQVIRDEGLPW